MVCIIRWENSAGLLYLCIMHATGVLEKLPTLGIAPVQYYLCLGDERMLLNEFIGKPVHLRFTGRIFCSSCGKKTTKSFGDGFCYSCFMSAPESSPCIIHPELCRAHLGEGRDPEWEKRHHLQPHYVYLAQTSDVKVGVTRDTQIPTRWIDQGAAAALLLAELPYRQLAGEMEVALKAHFSDKTNWVKMLTNEPSVKQLVEEQQRVRTLLPEALQAYLIPDAQVMAIQYPVPMYPSSVKSISLDKIPDIQKKLAGIRAQYLYFDDHSVLNIRKHTGYEVDFSA